MSSTKIMPLAKHRLGTIPMYGVAFVCLFISFAISLILLVADLRRGEFEGSRAVIMALQFPAIAIYAMYFALLWRWLTQKPAIWIEGRQLHWVNLLPAHMPLEEIENYKFHVDYRSKMISLTLYRKGGKPVQIGFAFIRPTQDLVTALRTATGREPLAA